MKKLKMTPEMKKAVLTKVKIAQDRLQTILKNQDWVDDVRVYAERQATEVKKQVSGDLQKAKGFLEKQRVELEKLQKQLPTDVKKFTDYVKSQRKEIKKLIANVTRAASKAKKTANKKGTKKKTA